MVPRFGETPEDSLAAEDDKKPSSFLGLLALFGAGAVADLASTEYALRSNPNAREGNPLMQGGLVARSAIKVGATLALAMATYQASKTNPNLAKAMKIGVTALNAGLVANNIRVAKRKS